MMGVQIQAGLFSLGDDRLSVFVHVGADGLAELLLQDLDLESLEICQLESLFLLLNSLAETGGVEPLSQLEIGHLLPF